jgi:Tfp pilus assembly protein PilF
MMTHIGKMRAVFKFLPFLVILPAGAIPLSDNIGGQQQGPTAPQVPSASQIAKAQARDLNQLFVQLRYSESAEDAAKTEAEIFIRLTQSSSPTVNLLLESANFALSNQDIASARSMLNDVVKLDPKFAEGLTRAASVAYQDGDLDDAQGLLKRALVLEPRHFGAWAGLALILEDQGDLKGAQNAYREALYLHPFLDGAKRGLIRLEAKIDGLSL